MRTPYFLLVGSVILLGAATTARADDDPVTPFIQKAGDSNATPAEREKAFLDARGLVQGNPHTKSGDLLKAALPGLLKDIEKKKTDATYEKVISAAMHCADLFIPFPDIGNLLRPFLGKDTSDAVRVDVLGVLHHQQKCDGCTKELVAIFEEATTPGDRVRESVEGEALRASTSLPAADCEKVCQAALKAPRAGRLTREAAFNALSQISGGDESLAKQMLMEYAVATYADPDLSCEAAVALLHWGTYDGIAEVMKRMAADRRGGSPGCYRAVCTAAHKLPQGFGGVPVEKFAKVGQAERTAAITEMNAWWEKAKTSKPDAGIFEDLAAAGVSVPKNTDPSNKETISALINGLSLENKTLRYACLDLLVKRTGRTDLAHDFKHLVESNGAHVSHGQEEPPQGFSEPKATQLFEQQKKKAEKWKTWWDSVSGHATWANGAWKT